MDNPPEKLKEDNPSGLKDKFYLSFILFYVMGTLTVLPGNFFPTANDYWMYKFRDPDRHTDANEQKTDLQADFTSQFVIASNVCNFAFLVITVRFLRRFSTVSRIVTSLLGMIFFFLITIIFVEINTDSWQRAFFTVTMVGGSLLTASGSIFMVTLIELAAKFPARYMAAVLSGQSICGIYSALVQIFALSVAANSTTTGMIYFLIGLLIILLSFLCFLVIMRKSEFFKSYLEKELIDTTKIQIDKNKIFEIFGKIKYLLAGLLLVQGCTIVVNPGLVVLVESIDKHNGSKWNDIYFVPVITFLASNIAEFAGRELAGKLKQPKNSIVIIIIGVVRIGAVPMFMYCNAQPRDNLDVVFGDWAYIVLLNIFIFTNGYFVNLCILQVPSIVREEENSIALILIVICMMISLALCSFINIPLIDAL